MKNNLDFFTHYADAHQNGKFLLLRASYDNIEKALAMEARFWILNSLIAKAPDARLDLSIPKNRAEACDALKLNLADLNSFLDTLVSAEINLLQRDENTIWTEQTQEDLTRAMKSREGQKNRRNGAVVQRNANETETLYNETETLDDVDHRAEQIRAEKRREEQQHAEETYSPESRPVDNSRPKPAAAAAKETSFQDLQNRLDKFPHSVSFSKTDLARLELRLQANALPPDFVDWIVDKVAADKSSKNPVGLLKKALLDYDERIDEYRKTISKKQASKKPKKALPPDKCPDCGGKIISTQFNAGCRKCGLVFEYDADFDIWQKKAEKLAQYQDSA